MASATTVLVAVLILGLVLYQHPQSKVDAFGIVSPVLTSEQRSNLHHSDCRALISHDWTRLNRQKSPWCVAPTRNLVLHGFLDGLFGGSDGGETDKENKILATYDVGRADAIDIDVRFESLSDYITNKWIDLFDSGSISLTTPVKVSKTSDMNGDADDSGTEKIDDSAGCRLLFQKVDTGYQSKYDEEDKEREKEQGDEPKQGGVEMLVQKVSKDSEQSLLRVVARRCEVDEETMIKEMSEEIIVKELQKAIAIWKKETAI